jgi:two-component system response regulator HydG
MHATDIRRILVVDDDHAFRLTTTALLRQDGYEVVSVGDGQQAVDALREGRFDLMLLDLRMPGTDGLGVVEALRRWGEGIPILMISGFGTVDSAVRALHLGADDFLTKPVEPDVLTARVADLLERRPGAENSKDDFCRIVGRSTPMQAVFDGIRRVAPTETTVLITGETGTGKELVAQSIHSLSTRRAGPLVAINCAAMSDGLLESELFGHVRGAFTGAVQDRPGLFEAAARGTLFLDEIGDVSPALQLRLLRAIQEREIRRVGSVSPTRVDVRIVAATRRDLRQEVNAGRLREDLFYRLNVFPIELPPLRERMGDIPLLVESMLRTVQKGQSRTEPLSCSPLAMRMLREYPWPGNVRELFAALESAAVRVDGNRIEAQHLPAAIRAASDPGRNRSESDLRYRVRTNERNEQDAILAALEEAKGSRTRAAEILGMGRTTLWRKLKSYGIEEDPDTEH